MAPIVAESLSSEVIVLRPEEGTSIRVHQTVDALVEALPEYTSSRASFNLSSSLEATMRVQEIVDRATKDPQFADQLHAKALAAAGTVRGGNRAQGDAWE